MKKLMVINKMTKEEIYKYLNDREINYEITDHQAVYNMDDLDSVDLPYKEFDAKNLFVRDDKKNNYYLITVKGDKRVDLKEFRKKYNTRPLSFAKEEELLDILNFTPGSVSPLGLLSDKEKKTFFFLDNYFKDDFLIGIHPNDNTATIWLKTKDLIAVIEEHGNQVNKVDIS